MSLHGDAFPTSDDMIKCAIDVRLSKDANTFAALSFALSVTSTWRRMGQCFLSLPDFPPNFSLAGSSLGLACAIELQWPGRFSDIAFTGFVQMFDYSSPTNGVEPIDNIELKIAGMQAQGIPFIFPFASISSSSYSHCLPTSTDITRNPERCILEKRVAIVTLLEAYCAALLFVS